MEDPVREIDSVVHGLCTSPPDEQRDTVYRVFTSDAAFEHPFCRVKNGPNSREAILGIFQLCARHDLLFVWEGSLLYSYKQISPKINLRTKGAAFDETRRVLYVDVYQEFTLWFVPWHTAKVNLTVRLDLVKGKDPTKWLIRKQTDFYQPEDFLDFTSLPFVRTAVAIFKHISTFNCNVMALATNLIGYQAPSSKPFNRLQ